MEALETKVYCVKLKTRYPPGEINCEAIGMPEICEGK